MQWNEDVCIVSGDNRAWQDGGEPKTVIELWCRSRSGHSTLLLVNGLKPYVEISDPSTDETLKRWRDADEEETGLSTFEGQSKDI